MAYQGQHPTDMFFDLRLMRSYTDDIKNEIIF